MKSVLITSGYPRSGSTYLNYALNLIYYKNNEVNINRHTVKSFVEEEAKIITFRSPLDCMSSWHQLRTNTNIKEDIKYYLRFYNEVINRLDKIVLFDFSKFTIDLDYIKNRVYKNFSIEPLFETTIRDIQALMIEDGKEINLPRNNKEELDKIKAELVEIPEFQDCINLYNRLLELA